MAEYAVAGILHFAKGFDRAVIDRDAGAFDHRAYRPLLIEGKTACVVGAGGIGLRGRPAVRRARHAGRRHPPPARSPGEPLPPGFSEIGGAGGSRPLAAGERFRRDLLPMDAGDDPALQRRPLCRDEAGQRAGQCRPRRDRRRGRARRCAAAATICAASVLDVYVGEFEHPPPARLWSDPRVLITPHVSGASDEDRHGGDRSVLRQSARLSRRPAAAQRHRLGTGLLKLRCNVMPATPSSSGSDHTRRFPGCR